jgi:hypothetical protein
LPISLAIKNHAGPALSTHLQGTAVLLFGSLPRI